MSLYQGQHRGVVLATATPVANSMAEIHTFQRFLQPNTLRALGLEQFDAWAATFGDTVTALEIAPDGSGYRLVTRFARFINVPDLMNVFCDVSDIRTKEMLDLPVPALKGMKPRIVTCRPSPELRAYVHALVKRAERLKTHRVDPKVDNMLKITSDGRKAALDMRLVAAGISPDPEGKVAKCAHEAYAIWQRTALLRRAQLVFCDLSTPKDNGEFSVYRELADVLIGMGVPQQEIAFVHDADTDTKKARLFKRVRDGAVRLLFGSTAKLGIGTNVQQRLVALHELDCPWRPCDVEQREGRILRQGNECDEVEILRYVTEGSFDAYSWQTVETKAKYIAQVMSGDKGLRSIEDVELATLSYAEVKALASGNPKVIEKAGVDADVARYASLFSVWRNQRFENESEVAGLPTRIASSESLLEALTEDAAAAAETSASDLHVTIHGRAVRGCDAIGDELRALIKEGRTQRIGRFGAEKVGEVGRFSLHLSLGHKPDDVHLYLKGRAIHDCNAYQTGPALFADLLATLQSVGQHRREVEARVESLRHRLGGLRDELAKPFEHAERLTNLLVRQRNLARELDLDKDEIGSQTVAADEEPMAA